MLQDGLPSRAMSPAWVLALQALVASEELCYIQCLDRLVRSHQRMPHQPDGDSLVRSAGAGGLATQHVQAVPEDEAEDVLARMFTYSGTGGAAPVPVFLSHALLAAMEAGNEHARSPYLSSGGSSAADPMDMSTPGFGAMVAALSEALRQTVVPALDDLLARLPVSSLHSSSAFSKELAELQRLFFRSIYLRVHATISLSPRISMAVRLASADGVQASPLGDLLIAPFHLSVSPLSEDTDPLFTIRAGLLDTVLRSLGGLQPLLLRLLEARYCEKDDSGFSCAAESILAAHLTAHACRLHQQNFDNIVQQLVSPKSDSDLESFFVAAVVQSLVRPLARMNLSMLPQFDRGARIESLLVACLSHSSSASVRRQAAAAFNLWISAVEQPAETLPVRVSEGGFFIYAALSKDAQNLPADHILMGHVSGETLHPSGAFMAADAGPAPTVTPIAVCLAPFGAALPVAVASCSRIVGNPSILLHLPLDGSPRNQVTMLPISLLAQSGGTVAVPCHRCGFYDVSLTSVDPAQDLMHRFEQAPDLQRVVRVLALPSLRDAVIHDLHVDFALCGSNAQNSVDFHRPSTFAECGRLIPRLRSRGVNMVCLTGALERRMDLMPSPASAASAGSLGGLVGAGSSAAKAPVAPLPLASQQQQHQQHHVASKASSHSLHALHHRAVYSSPYAVTDRSQISKAKGGNAAFDELLRGFHVTGTRCLLSVNPSRIATKSHHCKYEDLITATVDEYGRRMSHFALSDDLSECYDSLLVNWRKRETLQMFLEDVNAVLDRFPSIDGVRIDQVGLLPAALPVCDSGLERFGALDLLQGSLVEPFYAVRNLIQFEGDGCNPLLAYICRSIWSSHPHAVLLGDATPGRELSTLMSGICPMTSSVFAGLSRSNIYHKVKAVCQSPRLDFMALSPLKVVSLLEALGAPSVPFQHHPNNHPPDAGHGQDLLWPLAHLLFMLPCAPCTSSIATDTYPYVVDVDGTGGAIKISGRTSALDFSSQFLDEFLSSRASLRRRYDPLRHGTLQFLDAAATGEDPNVVAFLRIHSLVSVAVSAVEHVPSSQSPGQMQQQMCLCAVNLSPHAHSRTSFGTVLPAAFGAQPDDSLSVSRVEPKGKTEYLVAAELFESGLHFEVKKCAALVLHVLRMNDSASTKRLIIESSLRRLLQLTGGGKPDPANHRLLQQSSVLARQLVQALDVGMEAFVDLLQDLASVLSPPMDRELIPAVLQHVFFQNQRRESVLTDYIQQTLATVHNKPLRDVCRSFLEQNKLGSIVLITPEIAPHSKIGGVAVMVEALALDLASMGLEVHVISPYYNMNSQGQTDYLRQDNIFFHGLIRSEVAHEQVDVGLHYTFRKNVHWYYLHHPVHFPVPYRQGTPEDQLKTVVAFARASLELLCQKRILPSVIVTNDWPAGLVAAYTKLGYYGESFKGATLLHIVHNLEEGYQGKIFPSHEHSDLSYIHQLPDHIVFDSFRRCVDCSRAALMMSDQWGTVSATYRQDLLNASPYAYVLRKYPQPFAFSNGIRVVARREAFSKLGTHDEAKKMVQIKYFGGKVDPSIPVFSFVGRITEQKGVHLIVDSLEHLMYSCDRRIMVLIGGPASSQSDPYAAYCAHRMRMLRAAYPENFWCNPDAFFSDGPLVNLGSDFALMPSLFEPGGQVQQEYFCAGTPVIAFATGGLKDTVHEFPPDRANGFVFLAHRTDDLVAAVQRAMALFKIPEEYARLRRNASDSVLDSATVARRWGMEMARLRHVIWVEDVIASATATPATEERDSFFQAQEIVGQSKEMKAAELPATPANPRDSIIAPTASLPSTLPLVPGSVLPPSNPPLRTSSTPTTQSGRASLLASAMSSGGSGSGSSVGSPSAAGAAAAAAAAAVGSIGLGLGGLVLETIPAGQSLGSADQRTVGVSSVPDDASVPEAAAMASEASESAVSALPVISRSNSGAPAVLSPVPAPAFTRPQPQPQLQSLRKGVDLSMSVADGMDMLVAADAHAFRTSGQMHSKNPADVAPRRT